MKAMLRDINLAVVRRLCEHWPRMTREEFRECLASDSVYFNVPRPAQRAIGPDAAFAALHPWRERCHLGMSIINLQGDDTVVLCERHERFENRADASVIDLYVTGVFEMSDGKITEWRDYYDGSQSPSAIWSR